MFVISFHASVQARKKSRTGAPLSPSLMSAKPRSRAKKIICSRFCVLRALNGFVGMIFMSVSATLGISLAS